MSAQPVEPVAIAEQSGSPFLQLDFYRQSDQARFAGRDDEINAVVTGILSFDTFVVYGRSGLGKTSLLLAGVFPQLQQRGVTPIYTRVLDLPVAELQKKIETEIAAVPGSVILILDQFEEFFIRVREQNEDHPSRRMSACREMSAMLQDMRRRFGGRVRLLFGIREDYYAELEDFRADFPNIAAHGFRLLPLTAYGARRAIILMLERAHPPVVYEPNLVNLLLDEIARTGFDPLLLQIICGEVWREASAKRAGTNELREEDLRSVGGFEEIFQRYVKRAAEAAPDPLLVRVVLDTLITAEQTKRVVRASDLLRDGASTRIYVRASKEEVDALLAQLVELQLVRPLGESRERYELLHDRLVPVVKKWLESDKTFVDFRFAKKFIDSMASDGRFRSNLGRLISNEQMEQIVNRYAERLQLTPDETELLFRSSIHAGVRDWTVFWASRLDEAGEERSARTMDEMLTNMDFRLRLVAAKAVWALKSGHTFVPRLLQMAMEDRADIREAAARSFATLATDDDLAMLARYLGNRRGRERATAIVVECYALKRPTHHFPWTIRRRAWLAVRARSAAAEGEWIRQAMVRGAIRGTVSGLFVAVTIGFAIAEMVRWNVKPSTIVEGSVSDRVFAATVLAILGAAAGVLIGWASSRRMARRDAIRPWELFYGGPTRGVTQALVIWVMALFLWPALELPLPDAAMHVPASLAIALPGIGMLLLALFVRRGGDEENASGTIWLRVHRAWPWIALAVIALLAIALQAMLDEALRDEFAASIIITILTIPIASGVLALRQRCRGEDVVTDTLWTLVLAAGVAFLGTIGLLWLVERSNPVRDNAGVIVVATIGSLATILGCFRAAIIGSAIDPVLKERPFSPRTRTKFRAAAIASLLLAFAGYLALFGVESVPWLSKAKSLENTELAGDLLRRLPNIHYHNIARIADPMRLVTLEPSPGYSISTTAGYAQDMTSPAFASSAFRVAVRRQADVVEGHYKVTMRAYSLQNSGLPGIVVGEVTPEGGVWSARKLGDRNLRTDVILWDPDGKRTWALRNSYVTNAEGRTVEQAGAVLVSEPLTNIGRSGDLFATSEAVPKPSGFYGSRLILIGVEAPPRDDPANGRD